MKRSGKISRGGFTLVELAIVMGVTGLILGAIWWAASHAQETQRENDALNELQTVVQNIDGIMTGQKFQTSACTTPAGGPFPCTITASMITAQTIPSSYAISAAAASNPWGGGSFAVWAMATNQFRASFYKVGTLGGCIALLMKGTSCQPGQSGCPTKVGTGSNSGAPAGPVAANTCVPGNCQGTVNASLGWQVMTVTNASTLCGVNSYVGGANNSVEFYYAP